MIIFLIIFKIFYMNEDIFLFYKFILFFFMSYQFETLIGYQICIKWCTREHKVEVRLLANYFFFFVSVLLFFGKVLLERRRDFSKLS